MKKIINNPKRYQKYFTSKYLVKDNGNIKIYVVPFLKDDEVWCGEGDGYATSITPAKESVRLLTPQAIEVERIPVRYYGLLMNRKTYEKLDAEANPRYY